ncbi:TetR/AcrR family transcriptional regulator [Companilactobacillus ginsenosidimutans]|uniref:Transcriptional regulator n=1 Tax=Companilactobacillus ginsenosidimutans TaxID=1007676 RepID=A0A0H4QF99_9LACO|nr:TetR/AcrR family transcriptional regulator [Companilactobacillus ginsenosidimutans]AKP67064.1 transcriptional regulator [Companilactobacillus ginsenosidimutans]
MVGVKNNRRAQYTQQVIQDTVLSLLENKRISNITVTEVCKIADINRTTYYRYYDDIFQCVDTIETEFLNSIEIDQNMSPTEAISLLLNAFYERRKLSNLVFIEGKTKVLDKMQSAMSGRKPDVANDLGGYQEVYVMLGMQGILKKWVKDGMPQTPDELTKIIVKIFFASNLQDLRKQLDV